MLSDEIPAPRAVQVALRAVRDAMRLQQLFQTKLKNRILRYQYDALSAEWRRQERALEGVRTGIDDTPDTPEIHPQAMRIPGDDELSACTAADFLGIIAAHQDAMMATFADMGARVDDEKLRERLHELSEIAFAQKSKALTDLQLMKQHDDYL
jgi:hypothetical protein